MALAALAASAAVAGDDLYESAGLLPQFTLHGANLEEPGALAAVVSQVAYRKEVILVCGDAQPTASSANGLNTLLQLRALHLHHVLYLSDGAASCAALRRTLPEVACVWSSRISPKKPANGGLCVQLYWSYAFYFYDLRKHYAARMTIELGVNVLQTDTDVVWLANPYPALKRVFGGVQIVGMSDRPMINAGVFYAQHVTEGDGASWVLRELSRRIHTFILRPSAVRDYVPWAQAPYYANVDEQTLMNDCVRSAIANVSSFAQATAGWEVKRHRTGTRSNKTFAWKRTAEYRLINWLNRVVPAAGRKRSLPAAVPLEQLCGTPTIRSAGTVFPLHSVGSPTPATATLAIAPSWLFMHLPSSMAAGSIRRCRANASGDAAGASSVGVGPRPLTAAAAAALDGAEADRLRARTRAPFIMGHLAGVRTGPWSRRALMRAYGWWEARADGLLGRELQWGQRGGTLHLAMPQPSAAASGSRRLPTSVGSGGSAPLIGPATAQALASAVQSQAHLDVLVANLLLLGRLTHRRVILPEVPCTLAPSSSTHRGYGHRPVGARASPGEAPTCAWMAPKECWAVEYTTQLEYEREQRAAPGASRAASSRPPSPPSAVHTGAQEDLGGQRSLGTAGCDERARQIAHALTLPLGRTGGGGGAGGQPTRVLAMSATARNVTVMQLRRRVREMACDPYSDVPVLRSDTESGAAARGGGGVNGTRAGSLKPLRRRRASNASLLLEVLARVPLIRHPTRQLLPLLSDARRRPAVGDTPLTNDTTLRGDLQCIEALLRHALGPVGAATAARPQ